MPGPFPVMPDLSLVIAGPDRASLPHIVMPDLIGHLCTAKSGHFVCFSAIG